MLTAEQQQIANDARDDITKYAERVDHWVTLNDPARALLAATRLQLAVTRLLPVLGAGAED